MDPLLGILSTLLLLFVIPLFLWRRRASSPPESEEIVEGHNAPAAARQGGTRRMRRRNVAAASSSTAELDEHDDQEEEELDEPAYYAAKASKKKETKKQEKEARRQAEEASREMRKQKQDRYADLRRRKDDEREAEEQRKEEEARAQRAKEEAAANAEFEKWKDAFTIDTEGTLEEELQEESKGLLNNFVEYVKKHKCVALEDLAGEFHLRTQDTISRISSLEQMGRLSGVMDDRGKYIYISFEEMKAVAEYIKRQGRVSIAHLASKSNEFIDLEPKSVQEEDLIAKDADVFLLEDSLDYSAQPSVAVTSC